MTFAIAYNDAFRWLATITGMGPGLSGVEVTDTHVEVRMGWAFRARIPRNAIRSVQQPATIPFLFGMGVHGWGGTWAVNGSGRGGVKLTIEPPARTRVCFVPVRVKTLMLSLEEPEAFAATLDAPTTQG